MFGTGDLWEINIIDVDGECVDTIHLEKDEFTPERAKIVAEETINRDFSSEEIKRVADVHVIDMTTGERAL